MQLFTRRITSSAGNSPAGTSMRDSQEDAGYRAAAARGSGATTASRFNVRPGLADTRAESTSP